ncbi:MAG: type II secretion system F family protein [Hellea sp.]|nr:type II secretion system F family protein [Hellea sp.]
MPQDTQLIVFYALIFASTCLAISALTGAGLEMYRTQFHANMREKKKEKMDTPEALLMRMRRDRGLSREGYLRNLNYRIGKLVMQSGLPLKSNYIYLIMAGMILVSAGVMFLWKGVLLFALGAGIAGAFLPLLIVDRWVKRRRKKAAKQLPEALDVIIRSLKAGHPVPVALGLVGREMADPIGSEFGMASDEISFGGTVSGAIQRMADRIGQEDFDLFAAMIRLQEKTGGNLAELLQGNAATIRSRQRLRLKVRAASAEGRVSALILNAAPVGLYFLVNALAPDFYGDVENTTALSYGFIGIICWMLIGNIVIRHMINFKV